MIHGDFFEHMAKDAGGKHVQFKKRLRQDILRFRANAWKLIFGSFAT